MNNGAPNNRGDRKRSPKAAARDTTPLNSNSNGKRVSPSITTRRGHGQSTAQAIYGIRQLSLVDWGRGKGRLKIMTKKAAANTLFRNLSPFCSHAMIKPQQALVAFNLLIEDFEITAILLQKKSTPYMASKGT
jgi:hypothetical protein